MARVVRCFTIQGRAFQMRAVGWNNTVGAYEFQLWECDAEGNAMRHENCETFGYSMRETEKRTIRRVEMWLGRHALAVPLGIPDYAPAPEAAD